jgi:hypothetical protein
MEDTRIKITNCSVQNQEGENMLGDQSNDEHFEVGTGDWPNP